VVDGQQEAAVIDEALDPQVEASRRNGADVPAEGAETPASQEANSRSDDVENTADAAGEADDGQSDEVDESSDDESSDDEPEDDESDDEDGGSDNPLDVEGEVAADYLEELLDIADLDGDIDTFVENGRAHVSVLTDSDVLVGKDGEVLEALQELTRLAVITETGNRSRLMLDIAGYRDRRRKALTELATDAVQEAKDSGEPVRLSPMNPFERKIVHDVVAEAGLTSESEGEEPQRRVVILPTA